MRQTVYHVVAAIIRRQDEILLVQQQGPGDAKPNWALPGGGAVVGEVIPEALRREVGEETGLRVEAVGPLAYCAQVDNRAENHQLLAFVFEIAAWSGELQPADPDDHILAAAFLPLPVARERLAVLRWRVMREPILAYLGAAVRPGSLWCYRQGAHAQLDLVEVFAGG